jgi:hypothetical protein
MTGRFPEKGTQTLSRLREPSTRLQHSFVFGKGRLLAIARGLDQKALLRVAQWQRTTPFNRGQQIGDALVIFAASVVPVNFGASRKNRPGGSGVGKCAHKGMPIPFCRKRRWPSIQLSLTRDSLAHRGDKVSYPLAWTGAALL